MKTSTKTPLPETITVWHSSLPENKDSILRDGVTLAKFDTETYSKLIDKSQVSEETKKRARRRLLEAFDSDPSGLVCCSGDKVYSIGNGRATLETLHYLDGREYHGPVACFKIVLPIRMLEVLTPKQFQYLIVRFEELWTKGWFKARVWEARAKKWTGLTNPIQTYDHFIFTHVPPEFIQGVEMIEQTT